MTRRATSARPYPKDTEELIAYQEKRYKSFEYGRYGNPTTEACETKIRDLEVAPYTNLLCSSSAAIYRLTRVPFVAQLLV